MSIMRIAGAVALTALLAAPVQAAEPLQPTGKWNVDFGDAHCIAARNYGSPDEPITLAFKPSPIGDVMQLSVARQSGSKTVDQYAGVIKVDQATPFEVSVLGYASRNGKTRVSTINLPVAKYGAIRGATTLHVRSPGRLDATFALSQMEGVARALDRCVIGLRRAWNIAENAAGLRQPAQIQSPLRKYFQSADYPHVAWSANVGGTVALMLLINESGKIASCMVTETSGFASLDAQSCAVLTERARFNPAIGLDGAPVKGGLTSRIKWMMP